MTAAGRFAGIFLSAFVSACAAAPGVAVPKPPHAVALRNAGFEAAPDPARGCPSGWYCSMHADPHSFRYFHDEAQPLHGRRSLCIEPVTREPWALVSQDIDIAALRGVRVRFSIAVRSDALSGDGAGPYAYSRARSGVVTVQDRHLVQGTTRWHRVAAEISIPADALGVEVGVALEGAGRVCVDDAVLEILGPSKSPV